jgi:cytochrome c oxidase subunit 4
MDYGIINTASFLLGLIAWTLPLVNLVMRKKYAIKKTLIFSFLSMSACGISLYMQILYSNYLVKIKDWSALMDTRNGISLLSLILLLVTLVLNIVSIYSTNKEGSR